MASVAEAQQSTQTALAAAVAARRFPNTALDRASKLLTRLETPTRVSILGMPKSGKTGIFNLLAGGLVLPEGVNATVQLVHGDVQKATVTVRDGSKLTLEGPPDMDRILSLSPVFIKLEQDLPALRKISLLEVVTSYDRMEQIQAMRWAMKQTDIAIWCTDDFGASEQALWMDTPDALKDHAILLRTRADALGPAREGAIRQLERQAGNDFAYFMAVSAAEAHAARAAAGGVNKAQLKASGAMSLISTILRQIERGRQYAVDQAEILLHKHADFVPEAVPAPIDAKDPKAPVIAKTPQPKAKAKAETAPVAAPAPKAEQAPVVADSAEATGLSDLERTCYEAAVQRLADTGLALSNTDTSEPADVIRLSVKTVSKLSEGLEEADLPDTPAVDEVRTMAQDASDLMQLLKIEGDETSAMDAVSAMLQLKRGFQARLAA